MQRTPVRFFLFFQILELVHRWNPHVCCSFFNRFHVSASTVRKNDKSKVGTQHSLCARTDFFRPSRPRQVVSGAGCSFTCLLPRAGAYVDAVHLSSCLAGRPQPIAVFKNNNKTVNCLAYLVLEATAEDSGSEKQSQSGLKVVFSFSPQNQNSLIKSLLRRSNQMLYIVYGGFTKYLPTRYIILSLTPFEAFQSTQLAIPQQEVDNWL